jgi:hypothetical protein
MKQSKDIYNVEINAVLFLDSLYLYPKSIR